MTSSKDCFSNRSLDERLQPLDSLPYKHHLQRLPSFSEFISFTFPNCESYGRNVDQDSEKGMIVLSKLHFSTRASAPAREAASGTPISTIDKGTNRDNESGMKQIAGIDSENRTSFTQVQFCESSNGHKATLNNTARSVSILHPTQFGNDQGSSLSSDCSNQHDSYRVIDKVGKESTQRERNYSSVTRLYDCPFCPMVLMYQKHLISHVREQHDQKKPFGCPRDGCWQRFGGLGDMNRHVKTVHDGEKRFACELCARCFSRKSGLTRHAYHVHGGDYQSLL